MSSERKILLHIGLDKTGTTAIQKVLHANRGFLLSEEGLLYPSLMPNLSTPLLTIFKDNPHRHKANRMTGLTTEEITARQKNHLNSLDAEISSCEWSTLLLSAEGLSSLRKPELAKLREWGERYSSDWTILVCVRHPVYWACSVMQERLKQDDTLQQLYENPPTPKYRHKISNAISVFGKGNIRVFDFESATESANSIVGSFAAQAGLAAPSRDLLASQAVRANESLSLEAAHVLDSLNRQRPVFVDGVRAPRRPGVGQVLPYIDRIRGRKFDVPYSVKDDIRLQSREDVEWLNETFGLDVYRDVFDFAPRMESYERPAEALSDPAIESVAEIFGDLVTENAFHRFLNQGRVALSRDNLERAEKMFQKAAWLDPDAPQPKSFLKEVTEKRKANTREPGPQEPTDKRANLTSFLSRLWR